ncbi:lytic murein transglycosylase [Methylobacterium sp. BTF04]|uniref:lytic murein transglycosylase n=1 Tax=Methylobacterium sp. BTF04 TaxID=2708300 RepID=UPI0013D08787|nr:lytic murein transglycosylase [Methylobacterium sp. BTF04]NEU11234.1 lytic murein transglycosylase [Methylobacterium sp. BTF04]
MPIRQRRRRLALIPGFVAAFLVLGAPPGSAESIAPPAEVPQAPPPFADCLGEIAAAARARGVPQALIDARLLGLSPDPEVLGATRSQAEFVKPIWAYLDATITEPNIAEGRRKLQEWASTLDTIEQRFGVDRHILVAFWGVESRYGAVLDDPGVVRPVLRSLATLACGDQARAGYWRDELMAALQILAQGQGAPERLTGSWAGAMGHTQFMPTVYQAYAVDFDGDGRRDIWTSVPDALAATANYLRAIGWRTGEAWGTEVALPEGFDYALADESTERSLAEWRQRGVTPVRSGIDETARATLVVPAGAGGPAFLLLPNFRIILRYNTALAYGLTVAHLSDRLRGDPAFTRDWPRGDRVLNAAERTDLQTLLAQRGYAVGGIDGKIGPRTRAAVRAYQAATGRTPDGYADAALLEKVRAAP